MPSPAMTRSVSDTKVCEAGRRHSRSKSISVLPQPQAASSSGLSTGSVSDKKAWWRQLFLETTRSSWSRHSELTEERVLEHNIRTDVLQDTSSPYYRGLLYREKLTPSPERESHANTYTSGGSLSSIGSLFQNWSCRISKGNDEDDFFHPFSGDAGASKASISLMKAAGKGMHVVKGKKEAKSVLQYRTPRNSGKTGLKLVEKKSRTERVSLPQVTGAPSTILREVNREATMTDVEIFEKWNRVRYVWGDKYRPQALENFICNKNKASALQTIAANAPESGHLIFEGPPGVGKTTMIRAFIRETNGLDRLKIQESKREFDLKGESIGSIEIDVKESAYHIELNLAELRGYEKNVIVKLIKERHIKCNESTYSGHGSCKAIVLYEADNLPSDTLLYIRWLLERFKGFSKVFFCCSDVSKLQLIKGLCTHIELLPPSNEEIVQVLEFIAKNEGIELPRAMASKMAVISKNNLRQAIRSFEATWRDKYPFEEDQDIKNGWEENIVSIAKFIMEEQSPRRLYSIRRMLQYLIEHNVAADYLFKSLASQLVNLADPHLKHQIEALYNDYNRDGCCMPDHDASIPVVTEKMVKKQQEKMKKGQQFMKIEEFIAKFMSMYKSSMTIKPASASPLA